MILWSVSIHFCVWTSLTGSLFRMTIITAIAVMMIMMIMMCVGVSLAKVCLCACRNFLCSVYSVLKNVSKFGDMCPQILQTSFLMQLIWTEIFSFFKKLRDYCTVVKISVWKSFTLKCSHSNIFLWQLSCMIIVLWGKVSKSGRSSWFFQTEWGKRYKCQRLIIVSVSVHLNKQHYRCASIGSGTIQLFYSLTLIP